MPIRLQSIPGAFGAILDHLKSGHALPDFSFSASGGVVNCSGGRLDPRSGRLTSWDDGCNRALPSLCSCGIGHHSHPRRRTQFLANTEKM